MSGLSGLVLMRLFADAETPRVRGTLIVAS